MRAYNRKLSKVILESVPEGTFIHTYLKMMEAQETPLAYDIWCALWCLSNAVTRWAVVDRPRAPVRLNLYVVLVAESGVTRKSSAVSTAVKIVDRFIEKLDAPIEMLNTKTTPERLEEVLTDASETHGHAQFAFGVSEMVTVLGGERYNLQMPGLLTDLYDCPGQRKTTGTIKRGTASASRIYGTFLSASTPSWLMRAINPDVIEGGFTARCFFVVQEERKQTIAWPTANEEDYETQLVDHLCTLYKQFAPVDFRELDLEKRIGIEPPAIKRFVEWYSNRKLNSDPFLTSFESREDSHVLKVAGLLAINNGNPIITDDNIVLALHLVQEVKEQSSELLSYAMSNDLVLILEKIRHQLIQHPEGMKHSDLMLRCQNFVRAKRLTIILNLMHSIEMIRRFEYSPKAGRPGTIWTPTEKLRSSDFMAIMLEQMQGQAE